MNSIQISRKLCGAAVIATVALLDSAPSKAVLYIDFIPLSGTQTRIKASGTINPSLLAPFTGNLTPNLDPSGNDSSRINLNQDVVRFTYSSPAVANVAGRRFPLTGGTINPFTQTGANTVWTGTTPTNNPAFFLRFGDLDIWLPNTFTGMFNAGSTPFNEAKAVDAFFDVNKSLEQIGLASPIITYTSGTEQIILRDLTRTPGPVPLLGAAAAFGYSRKLRNRIQKSTPSPVA